MKQSITTVIVLCLFCLSSAATALTMSHNGLERALEESWQAYRTRFITHQGRVVDFSAEEITTSEGQSYAMLRAAWLNDSHTFNRVWNWTQENLANKETGLFAWKWGQLPDKSWGVLGTNSATDADQDIAFALIIAGTRWHNKHFIEQSKAIISHIWDVEVFDQSSKPYLTAGNWAKRMSKPRLNPSYMAPYIYRLFAQIDPAHDWLTLIDTSYSVLEQSTALSRISLPPDWCTLDPATGTISINAENVDSDYSYDAMRVPWRLAIDWQWHGEARAKHLLDKMTFFIDSWRKSHTIHSTYTTSGLARSCDDPLVGFACLLPFFKIEAPDIEEQILKERMMSQFYSGFWHPEDSYYGQNWDWFGIAALTETLTPPTL